MFIGVINIILAGWHFEMYQKAVELQVLNLITSVFYLWLAKKYWFNIPFNGVLVATICFCLSFVLINL